MKNKEPLVRWSIHWYECETTILSIRFFGTMPVLRKVLRCYQGLLTLRQGTTGQEQDIKANFRFHRMSHHFSTMIICEAHWID